MYYHAPVRTTELILCREVKFTVSFISARNKDQKLVGRFFEDRIFYRLLIAVPIENVQEIWPTKMDFGRPNAEIGRNMANDQLSSSVLSRVSFKSGSTVILYIAICTAVV